MSSLGETVTLLEVSQTISCFVGTEAIVATKHVNEHARHQQKIQTTRNFPENNFEKFMMKKLIYEDYLTTESV